VVALVQVPLDGGGTMLVQVSDEPGPGLTGGPPPVTRSGPVHAGRAQDQVEQIVTQASVTLRAALEPLAQMSRQVLEQFAESSPQEVEVQFGVALTAEAGAVLTKAGAACHLNVTLTWKQSATPAPAGG
jgi:hypothetical protein